MSTQTCCHLQRDDILIRQVHTHTHSKKKQVGILRRLKVKQKEMLCLIEVSEQFLKGHHAIAGL